MINSLESDVKQQNLSHFQDFILKEKKTLLNEEKNNFLDKVIPEIKRFDLENDWTVEYIEDFSSVLSVDYVKKNIFFTA